MIGIDIDVRTDREDEEAEVFVRHHGVPILLSETPGLAVGLKIEAVISLLRDIESDFGMLELEMQQDDNRIICQALKRRLAGLTDQLERELTQHTASKWSIGEVFGYMWTNDYKETLFLPALRADLMQASDGKITKDAIAREVAIMQRINNIYEVLDGE